MLHIGQSPMVLLRLLVSCLRHDLILDQHLVIGLLGQAVAEGLTVSLHLGHRATALLDHPFTRKKFITGEANLLKLGENRLHRLSVVALIIGTLRLLFFRLLARVSLLTLNELDHALIITTNWFIVEDLKTGHYFLYLLVVGESLVSDRVSCTVEIGKF